MFAAVSNYDISWPDPSVGGLDQQQKLIQAQNQYLIQTGSNDATDVGTSIPNAGNFAYLDSAISKKGVIALSPFFSQVPAFYYNGVVTSGGSLSGRISVTYCAANDSFYYGGETTGIVKIPVSDTGSNGISITGSGYFPQGCVDGTKIYYGPGSSAGPVKVLDTTTDTFTTLGNITELYSQPTLAPNGILFFGSGATTHEYYDLNTNTSGTCTGTTDADSAYGWILAGDGYLYSVPRFQNTKVYRIDPLTQTISMVLDDANYISSDVKRGQWLGPDGNIWTLNGSVNDAMYIYNWRTNTMSIAPYTYSKGSTDRPFWSCVMNNGEMIMTPWDTSYFRRYYTNPNWSGYINEARVGNQNFSMY